MPSISDYLQAVSGSFLAPQAGKWVRLVNNSTSTAYVSTAATDATGLFTVNNVPAGLYTVYQGPTATGAWTATGDGAYEVAPTNLGYFNVLDYGAKGDGSTDDTAAFNAAIVAAGNTGTVHVPTLKYAITGTITILSGTKIRGLGRGYNQASGASTDYWYPQLIGVAQNIMNIPYQTATCSVEGLEFVAGSDQLQLVASSEVRLRHLCFTNATHAGFRLKGGVERVVADHLSFTGAPYGIFMTDLVSPQNTSYLDKTVFRNTYFFGQSLNAVNFDLSLDNTGSHSVRWDGLTMNYVTQDGMVIKGAPSAIRGWLFENVHTESNGYSGGAATPATTGTISNGSFALTVASTTGLANGQQLTVAGAGANGLDLTATINSIASLVVTLSASAGTSVTDAEVVNWKYADIKFVGGTSGMFTIVNMTSEGAGLSQTRYAVDASGVAAHSTIIGSTTERPIYDPNCIVTSIQASSPFRRPSVSSGSGELLRTPMFGNANSAGSTNPRTVVASPPGGNLISALADSSGNAAGTLGQFEWRQADSARTLLAWLVSSANTSPGLHLLNALFTAASTTGQAGLKIPHGSAPTSPADGDIWTTSSGLFVRINGVTKTVTLT